MYRLLVVLLNVFAIHMVAQCQQQPAIENIIIATTDGFRWQELFGGMDSALASNANYNQKDSAGLFQKYWAEDITERRKKLMPFLWSTVAQNGQVYGNRNYGNKVDNLNPYRVSYPGYSEIFTGYVDPAIENNRFPDNPNSNLLEYISRKPAFQNKVAAFCAWGTFNRIFNKPASHFPVTAAFDTCGGTTPTPEELLLNAMLRDSYKPFGNGECLDVFTHYVAMSYLKKAAPRVLYIAYGETDEWAHKGMYRDYLHAANQVDSWLGELWRFIQTDARYKNKTALFITTDHGRGDRIKSQWTAHGKTIEGSNEIWFAVMGPGIPAKGQVDTIMQVYQNQFAQTIATLLGLHFTAEHPVGASIHNLLY